MRRDGDGGNPKENQSKQSPLYSLLLEIGSRFGQTQAPGNWPLGLIFVVVLVAQVESWFASVSYGSVWVRNIIIASPTSQSPPEY